MYWIKKGIECKTIPFCVGTSDSLPSIFFWANAVYQIVIDYVALHCAWNIGAVTRPTSHF